MKDTDGDGLTDRAEVRRYGTNPRVFDTDGDGMGDGLEVQLGRDPLKPDPVVPDTVAPDTTIGSGPSGIVTSGSASFSFSATEAGSSFECRLDTGAWTACTSPHSYTGLANGSHTFAVRARDQAGNTDATPATLAWTVNVPLPPSGSPTLTQVDGGVGYYGRFANALPTDASFFPIGVWGSYHHTQANLNIDADVGLNTYVWVADPENMPVIRADGRFHVIQNRGSRTNVGTETAGWLLGDETDMTGGPGACPGTVDAQKASLPADGRFRLANYGKGVLIWGETRWGGHSDASSACFVNSQDVTSTDLYWHTDPWETSHPQSGNSWGYGWSMARQRRMDAMDGVRSPQWGFVETGKPFTNDQGGDAITPAQIRGAVWHTLAAGARGIIYFQHSFGGSCITHHGLRGTADGGCYLANRDMVKTLNGQIRALAPVLNAPTVTSGTSASSSIRSLVKWHNGHFYVIAAANQSTVAQVSIPCVGDATATVLNEGRTVPVNGGSFSDQFADGNAAHIYRIDGGSTCGLSAG